MIHLIEENKVKAPNDDYKKCLYESMRCHHNEIAKYFLNNYCQTNSEKDSMTFVQALKYRNFAFFPNNFKGEFNYLPYAAKYNYLIIFDTILKTSKVDINFKAISLN